MEHRFPDKMPDQRISLQRGWAAMRTRKKAVRADWWRWISVLRFLSLYTVSGYRRSGKVGTVAKKLNCTQRLRICSEPLQGHLVLSGLQHGCQVLEITSKPHRGSRGVSRFLVPNSLAAHHKVSKAALVATALWPLALIVVSHKKYMGIQETRYIQGCN
jgi:hypothetical protein